MNLLFTELPSPKMHPANIGHDLTRDAFPLTGLKKTQYLDRVLDLEIFRDDFRHVPAELRTVFLTGAKVVKNAIAPATMGDWDDQRLEFVKFYTDLAHSLDPELIFDAVVSADIHPTVEYISVSPLAFEKLGRTPEKRKFCFAAMNTSEERELWYVHRALQFKAAGFDSLTFESGVPQKVIDLFAEDTPLVFTSRTHPGAKSPSEEDPVAIAEAWITQKQLEG
ncbi:MAG: hypothetical protein E7460_07235 [Ruminococcaceae bacterium]|nr:hypothetical protein [Oscillospiraceae bacterium]